MSGRKAFRLSVAVASFVALLFALAVVSPLVAHGLLLGDPPVGHGALAICLFLLTPAHWPQYLHILVYLPLILLTLSLLSGVISLLAQWYRMRRFTIMLRRISNPKCAVRLASMLDRWELRGKVDIVDTHQAMAFCYGWVRPRICLSMGAVTGLSAPEIEALLLHERHHMLNRDPLKIAISRAFTRAFFFVPVVRALQERYLVAKEIEADIYVLHNQRTEGPLLGALYKLLSRQPQGRQPGLAVAGYTDSLNQRLDFLLSGRVPGGLHRAVILGSSLVVAALSVVVAFATWIAAANALWEQTHSSIVGC